MKAGVVFASSFLIYTFTFNLYEYWNFWPRKIRGSDYAYIYNGSEDFLINTEGCYVPNYGKTLRFYETRTLGKNCGERLIFLKRINNTEVASFLINSNIMQNSENTSYDIKCFYRFGRKYITYLSGRGGRDMLSYTMWKPFQNGTNITIKGEIIKVRCDATPLKQNKYKTIYEDAYVFIKRLETRNLKKKKKTWNVLIIGMDTMSRERLLRSMPKTAKYFRDYGWLDFKGYHKVGYNTFPNLMAFLTGKTMKTIDRRCNENLYDCNDLFIWSRFRAAGYMTAYGEDYIGLPDTFHEGFRRDPTHHYIRPFFFTGESVRGNLVCAHRQPSALHILNYASDFTNVYKHDKFFGMFWINSYSHNMGNNPRLLDKDMATFLERLDENNILNNSVVLFISDHGIRFFTMRIPIESYYEERLPMLFVWVPHSIRKLYEEKYYNVQVNQNRLVTPYDIYMTLAEISSNFKASDVKSEACPQCTSLFVEIPSHRTCDDANIDDKWCTCHGMNKADLNDSTTNRSLYTAVEYIQNVAKSVKTTTPQGCRPLYLQHVIRAHWYTLENKNSTYYVVAWSVTPGNMSYEATVAQNGENFTVLPPTHAIASYETNGTYDCVEYIYDLQYCVCY